MKKTILIMLIISLSTFVFANSTSTVFLTKSAEIKPKEQLNIFLDSLIKEVTYTVSCILTNKNSDSLDVQFDTHSEKNNLQTSTFMIDSQSLPVNQTILKNGENKLEVIVSSKQNGNALVIKNLDLTSSLQVNNCVATPAVHAMHPQFSSWFVASNDTNNEVTIGVGNFIPTSYVIPAHGSKIVIVSSDNQNIAIKNIK